jgi:hypothetical protein
MNVEMGAGIAAWLGFVLGVARFIGKGTSLRTPNRTR